MSFEELLNYWKKELQENASNIMIKAVAANKTDMSEYEEVSQDVGKEYAKDIGGSFFQTSAMNAIGIDVYEI
jgi:hypothetical protein